MQKNSKYTLPKNLEAIVFDMDDTLYNEYDFVVSGFRAVAKELANKYLRDEEKIFQLLVDCFNKPVNNNVFDLVLVELGIVPSKK